MGVYSLIPVLGLILGPMALVFGIIGKRYACTHPSAEGKPQARTAIMLGALTSVGNWGALLTVGILLFLGMPKRGETDHEVLNEPLFSRNRDLVEPGKALAVSAQDGLVASVRLGRSQVMQALFAPNGATLAVCADDGYRLVNSATSLVMQIAGHGALAFSADSQLLAIESTENGGNRIVFVDARSGEPKRTVLKLGVNCSCDAFQFSKDGRFFTAIVSDPKDNSLTLPLWQINPWKDEPKKLITRQGFVIKSPVFSPDSTTLAVGAASAGTGGDIHLLDVETGRPKAVLGKPTETTSIGTLAFLPDGKTLICSRGAATTYWDTEKHEEVHAYVGPRGFEKVIWSPDGNLIATCGFLHDFRLWDAKTVRQLAQNDKEGGIALQGFSPDGRMLVIVKGNQVQAWDVAMLLRG
jgi:WD40 repeat protein